VFGASSFPRREIAIVDEEAKKRRSMEQVRAHLARADSELLEAAHRLLDPLTVDEFGMDVVCAVANARTLVGDALETIRARLWE
jgi:cellobiose-specific phosphotransferase system component IIA